LVELAEQETGAQRSVAALAGKRVAEHGLIRTLGRPEGDESTAALLWAVYKRADKLLNPGT
jgi:hypothetical protein